MDYTEALKALDTIEKELDQQYGMATASQLLITIQTFKLVISDVIEVLLDKSSDVPSRE